ncbi:hypothetical protein [Streptomyces sp. NPDC047841]|uniref:hypothetical protein n=1 Tax=Streptomyces sp. NPDC047841 TaxID=3154708 RepID=UPI0034524050
MPVIYRAVDDVLACMKKIMTLTAAMTCSLLRCCRVPAQRWSCSTRAKPRTAVTMPVGMGQDVNSPEPDIEQKATGRLLDLVRSFVTTHVSWKPLFIGAVITGDDLMRLYFRSLERDRTYGVDVLISHTGPGLLGSLVSSAFLANEHLHRSSGDPHCDVIADLTDY